MCCKGFLKRIVPFFLTFAVGLFIASFFVSIVAPNFQFSMRGEHRRHFERDRMMQFENQRLNEENLQLKKQLEDMSKANVKNLKYNYELDVPPVPLMPPPPPVPMPYSRR